MAATTSLREALNKGISSGNLVDTKVILYSRRDPSGRVSRPKVLYASSHVLKTVSYFNDMLFGNFAESQSKDFDEAICEDESTDDYGYFSDSDLEDSEDDKATSPDPISKSKIHLSGDHEIVCEGHEESVEKGKVVKIPDIAFVTFQAFLIYLYTGAVEFAPFGSEQNRRSRSAEVANPPEDKIPSSPKSIYRLADKYDVPALKTLALNRIRDGLSKCDIVEESFSRFASRYDEIRGLYVEQLALIWVEDWSEATHASIEEKIDSFAEGDLEHATETISALWGVVKRDGDIKAPPSTSSAVAQAESPARWDSVKVALIRSIRTGVFFDRKCWARCSSSVGVLKPVYFSSTIMKDKTKQMNRLVKYFIGQNTLTSDLEEDVGVESDFEEGLQGFSEETQMAKDNEEPVRAVFIVGSFSAWKSLFFYRCTDEILFAPLKSQGADFRLTYIRENTVEAAPPPCSPKSIYVLANLLGIEPLRDNALADIESKATSYYAEGGARSWITAIQGKVKTMESELFILNLKDPRLIGLVRGNIGRITDESSSHFAGTLKLGLKKAVELKRQSMGVQVRCRRCGYRLNTHTSRYYPTPCLNCTGAGRNGCDMECVACLDRGAKYDPQPCKNCKRGL